MSTLRYTICSYYPDLYKPGKAYDFAVLVASQRDMVLLGVNLSAYGLEEKNPFGKAVIQNTIDFMKSRVSRVCEDTAAQSLFEVLDEVVVGNESNLQFRPFKEFVCSGGTLQAAQDLFEQEIREHLPLGRSVEGARQKRPMPIRREHAEYWQKEPELV